MRDMAAEFVAVMTAMTGAFVAVAMAKVLVVMVLRDVIVCAFDCVYVLLWGRACMDGPG